MPPSNNTPPAENRGENIFQTLKLLGFEFYIDKNGKPQSKRSWILDPEKLLTNPVLLSRLKGGWFFSDPTGTQWIYISIRNGRIADFITVTSLFILGFKVINYHEGKFDFIHINYSTNTSHTDPQSAIIHYSNYTPTRITNDIKGLAYLSKEGEALKGPLVYYLVSQCLLNANPQTRLNIGPKQGWWITPQKQYRFAPESNYIPEIKAELPIPLQYRESSKQSNERCKEVPQSLLFMFDQKWLLMLLLFNLASLLLTFFGKNSISPDNILILKPTKNVYPTLLMAILNNVNYSTFNIVTPVGPQIKELKKAISWVNDGVLVVLDIFSADQYKKAEPGYDLILNNVGGASQYESSVNHIIALISGYADLHLTQDKCCILEFGDQSTKYSPIQYRNICRQIGDALINKVESDYNNFINIFKKHLLDVLKNIPESIPKSKMNTYKILITTLRTYNDLFSPLFSAELEEKIVEWLCMQEQEQQSVYDIICSDYGVLINKRMDNNYYNYTTRVRHGATPFDKGLHTIIVDMKERYFFIEPEENFTIVKEDMPSINDTDSLTTALYNEKYLDPNEHNSKCNRIRTIDSNGISHTTRMHKISLDIISPENQKRFALIGKDEYLFRRDELPTENFLPLIKTVDGRYAGKMLRYDEEENNFYLGTGRIGSGKSWAIAQIMPMLKMLGHAVVAFDVSDSYTRKKLVGRKMLPEDVVDNLLKFITVGVGQDKIPVNFLDFSSCSSSEEARMLIRTIFLTCAGKLTDKQDKRLDAYIYQYLDTHNVSDININEMCEELKESGAILRHIAEAVEPVIDHFKRIGFENKSWADLFAEDKVLIMNLGNEVGNTTHQLLDILVNSVFRWHIEHDTNFLSVIVDELKDQNLSKNSPLNTLISEGRKFHTALWGAKQDFFNQGSSYDDVLKQSNLKSFCRPGKSDDRIAKTLGYSNAIAAGFNNFRAGDVIMDSDFYNRELDMNTPTVIKGRVVDFVETHLYDLFKEKYLDLSKNYCDNTR